MHTAITLASVDLGSNSFRLEIGSYEHQQIHRVEYLKESIRQGNGLDAERNLTAEAMERGWACLARFGERLRGFDPAHVSAVATQTLREARNRDLFIERGSALLGFPIDVISGEQEARLIYRGVVSQLPATDERRLVMDIGGRSTEFILGRRHVAEQVASYRLGSVAWSTRYFPQGALTRDAFAHAELAAAVLSELLPALARFDADGLAPFLMRYARHDVLQGRPVLVHGHDDVRGGVALGVAADGALRVRFDDGERPVHAGEVSVRRVGGRT